jgi:hypothetical protein
MPGQRQAGACPDRVLRNFPVRVMIGSGPEDANPWSRLCG